METVAPHAGAWIETGSGDLVAQGVPGRTPRGCVD